MGGYNRPLLTGVVSGYDFIDGLTSFFHMYDVYYALTKTVVFAFVISTISSFVSIEGGALGGEAHRVLSWQTL